MSKKRRSFTVEDKLQVLREAETEGMLSTCRKYSIAQSLFYRWKHAFERSGVDGLAPAYRRVDPEVRSLENENERLKRIIAKQALELEVKSELLKKKTTRSKGAKNGSYQVQRAGPGKLAM